MFPNQTGSGDILLVMISVATTITVYNTASTYVVFGRSSRGPIKLTQYFTAHSISLSLHWMDPQYEVRVMVRGVSSLGSVKTENCAIQKEMCKHL